MNPSVRDISFMRRALELAARGLGTVEPNPMVGAVLVQGDRIVGEGFTAPFGGPHAEVEALRAAGDKARGAELFVSLEPCCHFGKTPPCTDAILAAGVRRVVAAVEDPFPAVSGKGLAALAAAGLETSVGVLAQEARLLNAAFFKRQLTGLPLVIAKWAMTLDGRIATAAGDSRWISSEESRRRVHEVRRVCDAVLVGSGTALKDSPSLTVRHVDPLPSRGQPTRVILDARLRIDPAAEPMTSARQTPVLIYTTPQGLAQNPSRAAALRDAGCELVTVPQAGLTGATGNLAGATGGLPASANANDSQPGATGGLSASANANNSQPGATGGLSASANAAGVSLRAVLEDLGRRGMSRVLVEGGPQVFASLFAEGLADRVMIFVAPKILAISGAPGPVSGPDGRTLADALAIQDLQVETLGPDLLIHGRLGEY